MKTVTYKCNGDGCLNQTNDIKSSQWIEIGSNNDSLLINNYSDNPRLITLSNHDNIHFCSPKCLTEFLFVNPK